MHVFHRMPARHGKRIEVVVQDWCLLAMAAPEANPRAPCGHATFVGRLLCGEEPVVRSTGTHADADWSTAPGATTSVRRSVGIHVDASVNTATGEVNTNEPPRFFIRHGVFRGRAVARNVQMVTAHHNHLLAASQHASWLGIAYESRKSWKRSIRVIRRIASGDGCGKRLS